MGENCYFPSSVHIIGKAWMLAKALTIRELYSYRKLGEKRKCALELVSREDRMYFFKDYFFLSFRKVTEKDESTRIHLGN